MRALFIYVGHYGSSRCDTLEYVGLLPEGGDPIALIKACYEHRPDEGDDDASELVNRKTGKALTMWHEGGDGETSYLILDLDQPGAFLTSFEHEDSDLNTVKIKLSDLGIEPGTL